MNVICDVVSRSFTSLRIRVKRERNWMRPGEISVFAQTNNYSCSLYVIYATRAVRGTSASVVPNVKLSEEIIADATEVVRKSSLGTYMSHAIKIVEENWSVTTPALLTRLWT